MVETEELVEVVSKEKKTPVCEIIVHNDDVNSFEWVITSFIEILQHEAIQAEQCVMIVHNNGKCAVKRGSYKELEPKCTALLDRGLSATIDFKEV